MTLRLRLQPLPETIQEFDLAAEERYWTGLDLMTRGESTAGIYFMGYAAEMLAQKQLFLAGQIYDTGIPGRHTTWLGETGRCNISARATV